MCVELYQWSIELEGIFVLPLALRWVRHSYLPKTVAIPYTCGLSRPFAGAVAGEAIAWGEYSRVCLFALSLSNFYLLFLFSIFSYG